MVLPVRWGVVSVGRSRVATDLFEVRTPAQRATVAAIIAGPDFDFACAAAFDADLGDYAGSFSFTWYSTDGVLNSAQITPSGRVTARARSGEREAGAREFARWLRDHTDTFDAVAVRIALDMGDDIKPTDAEIDDLVWHFQFPGQTRPA